MIDRNEWLMAHKHLDNAPNGTKLPYSVCPDGKYKNGNKPYRTTHSFIKIDGKIYGIAQGKSPAAVLGSGTFGKVKLIEDEQGNKLVVKIELTNYSYQQNEFQILKDQKLALGKAERLDKSKYYTVMNFMGLPLKQRLAQYELQFFLNKPSPANVESNKVYLYMDNGLICASFKDLKNTLVEKILTQEDIEEKEYNALKDLLQHDSFKKIPADVTQAIPLQFLDHRANNDEIKENMITFYPNQGEMRYSFSDQDRTQFRHPFAANKETFETICSTLGVSSLSSLTEAKRLDYAIDICLQVANLHEGISSASGTAYAHLDIKPDNIVVNKKGRAFLVDFGLSKNNIKAVGNIEAGTENYLPWSDNGRNQNLTREQLDLIALKRTLFFPTSYYATKGHYASSKQTQKNWSVLTEEMLNKYNLTAYISTDGITDFSNDKMTARTLAAMLIKARQNLASSNYELINNPALSNKISSKYERDLDKENAKFCVGSRTILHKTSNEARETLEYNNNHYEILDGTLNFADHKYKKFASTGTGREALLLDVNDLKMREHFREFVLTLGSNPVPLENLFDKAIKFSNTKIKSTDFNENTKKAETVKIYEQTSATPVFTLQEVIAGQKGVCRHHALFVSFLLGEYFKQNPIKDLSIHHCRDSWQNSHGGNDAHAWVICRQDDKLTLIDAMWKKQYNLSDYKDYTMACKTYRQEVIDKIFTRAKLTAPGIEQQLKYEEEQRRLEEEQRKEAEKRIAKALEEEQLKQKERVKKAEQVITMYEAEISVFVVRYTPFWNVQDVQTWQNELLKDLNKLTFYKTDLTDALKTLNITGQHPKIREAIAAKTQEINSSAQSHINLIEKELRKEEEKRIAKELKIQKQKSEEQQLKAEILKQEAEQVISSYVQKINTLNVSFTYFESVSKVNRHKQELLDDLDYITCYGADLHRALHILNITEQHPNILAAISKKTTEINSAAQLQISKIEEEQQRKLEKEQQNLEQQKLKAEAVITTYALRTSNLCVKFDGYDTSVYLVNMQKKTLLNELNNLAYYWDYTDALSVLKITGQHPKIIEAIAKKTDEINNAAQLLINKIEDTEQKRKLEEQQQRAEQQKQNAERVIDKYEQKINDFHVQSYFYSSTEEQVNTQKNTLLKNLGYLTYFASDLKDALETLNITGQHPKINQAIAIKTKEINAAAQLQINKIEEDQRKEKEKRVAKEQQEQQHKLQEQEQQANNVINLYEEKINSLVVQFNTLKNVGLVKIRQNALLDQLNNITLDGRDLTQALKTLNITGQHPKISNAIDRKTDEINTAAQLQQNQIEKTEQEHEAIQVINSYEHEINSLFVQFNFFETVEQILEYQESLLERLNNITADRSDLTDALNILNIEEQHPDIVEAIGIKTKEINSAAQLQISKIEAEKQQQSEAEEIIKSYVKQINQVPVQFDDLITFAHIYEHQKQLLQQLDDIILYRRDLTKALKTLNISGQHNDIRNAIYTKTDEIKAEAQSQLCKVEQAQRREEFFAEELKEYYKQKKHESSEPNDYHKEFNIALEALKQKRDDFESNPNFEFDQKIKDAYYAANDLYHSLDEEGKNYFGKNPTSQNYETFKARCDGRIREARSVLDNHRGWGKILLNVFAIIATAGIGYALAAVINVIANKGKFTFFSTDSSQKISAIEEKIEAAGANFN